MRDPASMFSSSGKCTAGVRQCGAALITTLLIVALITITITTMTSRQQLSIQKASNRQVQVQLQNLLGAGEKFAMTVLNRDRTEGERNNSDSTEDYWAESLPPVPVDGATVEGCVIDLQGKFNLNNLIDDKGNTVDEEYQRLRRLLSALGIETLKAEAILDWIDPNIDVTGSDGAEDDFYTGQTPAYRTANGPMVSPTELLLVHGFRVVDEGGLDDYDVLLQHIATLPVSGTRINVNTASSAVIASLADYMIETADDLKIVDDEYWKEYPGCPEGGGLLDSLINSDSDDSASDVSADSGNEDSEEDTQDGLIYENIEPFIANAKISEEQFLPEEIAVDIGVVSSFFMTRVTVTRDESSITQYTVFERDNNGALKTLRRSRGSL